ncbi:MAG: hypothetical protein KDA61_09545 [Planctomycetales bacterium]|nr:hypothetical protein [Planctomycetales bacterium]
MLRALALLALAVVGGCVFAFVQFGWMGLLSTPVIIYVAYRVAGLVSPALFGHWVYAGLEQATRPMAGASIFVNDVRPTASRWEQVDAEDRSEFGEEWADDSETQQYLAEERAERARYEWRTFDLTITPAAGDEVEWGPNMICFYSEPGPAVRTAADACERLCEVTKHEVFVEGKWRNAGNRKFRGELRVRMTGAVPKSCRRFGLIYALTMLVNDFEEPSRPPEPLLT